MNVTTTTVSTPSIHDLQLYGVVVTILLCFIVFGGVKIINKVAPTILIPVLFSLFCIFIGAFVAPRSNASSKFFIGICLLLCYTLLQVGVIFTSVSK